MSGLLNEQVTPVAKKLAPVFQGFKYPDWERSSKAVALLLVLARNYGEGDAYSAMILKKHLEEAETAGVILPLRVWRRLSGTATGGPNYHNDTVSMMELLDVKYPNDTVNDAIREVKGR